MKVERKHISRRQRAALFEREKGVCYLCGGLVMPGQAWEVEHEIDLALGGKDDETNWKVAHKTPCHRDKTRDKAPVRAKVKRLYEKHIGAEPEARKKIQSRGFTKRERRPKLSLPKRETDIFGNAIGDSDEQH